MLSKALVPLVALVFCGLVAHRVWRSSQADFNGHAPKVLSLEAVQAERELYQTPGGKYTWADIEANGQPMPSQKFRGFVARHDLNPRSGELLCPVTRTKANPACQWIIGGRAYQFCCPPCIDEFVRLAKERPDEVKLPEDYVKP